MFEIIFIIFVSLYFLTLFVIILGVQKKFEKLPDEKLPSITILVAARNEEKNILDCLESLNKLIYPPDKIEIIVVNDNSTDSTGEIIEKFISDKHLFKCIVPQKVIGDSKGKANAIANGLEIATGEIILTTDADCMVSETWAKTIASYFTKDVAFVGGYTSQTDSTPFEAMQSIDFIYLLTVAAGTINLGKPLSCIGNNMAYRKSVYDEIGGYENITFSVTEDFQLLMAIHKLKKYKIIYPFDPDGHVVSKSCPDFKTLFRQKRRWGKGGLKSDLAGFSVAAVSFIVNGLVLLTPFFFSTLSLYLCAFKVITDYMFVRPVFRKLNLRLKLSDFLVFEFYYILYVLILPFIVLLGGKIKWKGRSY